MNKEVRGKYGITQLMELLRPKIGVQLRPSVLMKPWVQKGLVFNDGAERRLLAITRDGDVEFRKRSMLGAKIRDELLNQMDPHEATLSEDGVFLNGSTASDMVGSRGAALAKANSSFLVSGGTQWSMGRFVAAVAKVDVTKMRRVTPREAELAYASCGFTFGCLNETLMERWKPGDLRGCRGLWPVTRREGDNGAAVSLNMDGDLGFPYHAKPTNDEALDRCLGVLRVMEEGAFRHDPAGVYGRELGTRPGLFLFTGKTKSDVYSDEKIRAAKLRFYNVTPGHLKLYLMRATQPFAKAKMSLYDVRDIVQEQIRVNAFVPTASPLVDFHSAQKIGMTGDGPTLVLMALDAQVRARGFGYMHCGDDTIFAYRRYIDRGDGVFEERMVLFSVDMSNFDLTQRADVSEEIDRRLGQGIKDMKPGDEDVAKRADLWVAVQKRRNLLLHGSGVVEVSGIGASGLNLQSEKNDMYMDVFCQRLYMVMQAKEIGRGAGSHSFDVNPVQLKDMIVRVASAMGLTARLEDYRMTDGGAECRVMADFPASSVLCDRTSFRFLGYMMTLRERYGILAEGATRQGFLETLIRHQRAENGSDFVFLRVVVLPDLPRFIANIQYATKFWVQGRDEFELYDCVRLFGSLLTMGNAAVLRNVTGRFGLFDPETGDYPNVQHYLMRMIMAKVGEILKRRVERSGLSGLPPNSLVGDNPFSDAPFGERGRYRFTSAELEAEFTALPDVHVFADIKEKLNTMAGMRRAYDKCDQIFDPYLKGGDRGRPLAIAEPQQSFSLEPVAGDWADIAEADDLAVFVEDAPLVAVVPTLQSLALRSVTQSNWGRPPPSAAVTNPVGAGIAEGRIANPHAAGEGSSRTQRKKAQRKRQKAKRNQSEAERRAEETAEHFHGREDEEAEEASYRADLERQRRDEEREERALRREFDDVLAPWEPP